MKKAETQITTKKEIGLVQMVEQETESRKVLTQFITNHMKDGTDFGTIMIGGRASKPSLFKSGAEKFASLMRLRADVIKDADTYEMAGNKPGLFCYRCNLYNQKNEIVGMGLGACSLEEKKSYNNAIKIAKKRAFVDAILTTGALSDFFTQDLEDLGHEEKPMSPKQMRENTSETPQTTHTNGNGVASEKQLNYIKSLLTQKGFTEEQLKEKYEITNMAQLTSEQASTIIGNLMKLPNKVIEPEENIDMDEVDEGIKKETAKKEVKVKVETGTTVPMSV